jgi:Holliday junction resolvase RusA-like endonuclease
MMRLWVPGHPKTKGSMEQQRGRRMVQSVEGSEEWALIVERAARAKLAEVFHAVPYVGPVAVRMAFWLPVADCAAGRPGDLDKLIRNVLDALTKAGVYGDDAQVTHMPSVGKYPVGMCGIPTAGVLIEAWPCQPHDGITWAAVAAHEERRALGLTT